MDIKIFDGRNAFYQWDVNQKLILSGMTSDCEIHFKNIFARNALVVKPYEHMGFFVVDVPNILLQHYESITAWVYVDGKYTNEQAVFKVVPRQKPADYVYTETEILRWETMEKRIEAIEKNGTTDDVIEQAVSAYLEKNPIEANRFIDTVTGKEYILEVVNGKLTMSEVSA